MGYGGYTKKYINSSSVFGPLTNTTPYNIGPGSELPIPYMFYKFSTNLSPLSINTSELIAFDEPIDLKFPNKLINSNVNQYIYNTIPTSYFTTLRSFNFYNSLGDTSNNLGDWNLNNYEIIYNDSAYLLYSDTGIISDTNIETNNGEFKYAKNEIISVDSVNLNLNLTIPTFTQFKDESYVIVKNDVYLSSIDMLEAKTLSYKYSDFAIKVYDLNDSSISSVQWGRSEDQIHDLITDTTSSASGLVMSENNFAGMLVSDGITSSDNLIAYIDFGMEKPVVEDALIYNFIDNKFIDIKLNE